MLEMLFHLVDTKLRHQHCCLDPSCFHQERRLRLRRRHFRRPQHQLHIQFRQHRLYLLYRLRRRHRMQGMHLRHRLVRQHRLMYRCYQQQHQWNLRQIRHLRYRRRRQH